MSDSKYRYLRLIADGNELAKDCRIRVTGKSTMSLTPDAWQIDLYNVHDADIEKLKHVKTVSVVTDKESVICVGNPIEVGKKYEGADEIIFLSIRDGGLIYDSCTSVSVAKNSSVYNCVRMAIANASTSIISSVSAPMSQTFSKGTTYFGQTVQYIRQVAESLNLNAYIFHDVLYIQKKERNAPAYKLQNIYGKKKYEVLKVHEIEGGYLVQTDIVGMQVGKRVYINSEELKGTYKLISQIIDADDASGGWKCWLLLANEDKVSV